MRGMKNGKVVDGHVSLAVLFDPSNGDIVHVHRVIDFRSNEQRRSPEYVQQRARDLYAREGRDASKLNALSVDPAEFKRGRRYKVDLKTSALTEIQAQKPGDAG